jgi:2-hydroxycyclohexanecarboxyl-CoA dehydrogenase
LRRLSEQTGVTVADALKNKADASPLKTLVPQASVANVVSFLCSDAASMMTGQDINVSAGVVMY